VGPFLASIIAFSSAWNCFHKFFGYFKINIFPQTFKMIFSNFSTIPKIWFLTSDLKTSHKCSIRFESGLWEGHSNILKNSYARWEICLNLFCCMIKFHSISIRVESFKLCFKISTYMCWFMDKFKFSYSKSCYRFSEERFSIIIFYSRN